LLLDSPDPQRDQKLSEHIMKLHNNNAKRKRAEDEENKGLINYVNYERM
jgi:DNA replicative helicase MCM subunit Mcm2 (Cdc46/Mcm family)